LTPALGQARSFERLLRDFRCAFESRNIARPRLSDRRHQAGAQAIALLDKAQAQSTEVALCKSAKMDCDCNPILNLPLSYSVTLADKNSSSGYFLFQTGPMD